MMGYLLGVDIGTSGTKTVLFDEMGNTIAHATIEYPLYQPQMQWAEQDPQDWWNATAGTIAKVLNIAQVQPDAIAGVGISGQMHGLVLLDREGQVLCPAIIWCDQRTAQECAEITCRVGKEQLIAITANPALTGFTASKLMWVRNHRPKVYERICHVLLPKDYVRYKLTGEFATEVSDASGTQWLDIQRRDWSDEVIAALDMDKNWLPKVYESFFVSGWVHEAGAAATGLAVGTPVVGGAGDQAAGAIGNGIVEPGIISSTIGTSGVVFAHTDKPLIDALGRVHTFCHAVPGKWHIMGVTQGAGLSLRWMRDEFCSQEKQLAQWLDVDPYELMAQEAQLAEAGCMGLVYLPYMMGERTPHLNPDAKGVFFGLSAMHSRREMIRAVMEGVSYSLLDCMNVIRQMGADVQQVRASGGGGRSDLWRQIQADMFDTPMVTINSSEGPALGVALLAGVGTGVYASVEQACRQAIRPVSTQMPISGNVAVYKRYYPLYQQLYQALKPSFQTVKDIMSQPQ